MNYAKVPFKKEGFCCTRIDGFVSTGVQDKRLLPLSEKNILPFYPLGLYQKNEKNADSIRGSFCQRPIDGFTRFSDPSTGFYERFFTIHWEFYLGIR